MTSTLTRDSKPTSWHPTPGRRFGYLIAIAINAWLLWFVNQLPDWEWPRFLTDEFSDVLPVMTAAIVASIVVNVLFFWYDATWFKSLGNLVAAGFGFAVALRLYQVFPFDFATYASNWSWLARFVVIVALAGTAIGFIAESVKLVTLPFRRT
jgi:hypothetical protein